MDNNNLQVKVETSEVKSKSKLFWRTVGCIALAVVLACLTVFVLNLNR